jgi:hypothetical protein
MWRAVLDLAGGSLRFSVEISGRSGAWSAKLCNGDRCEPISRVRVFGDSLSLEIADYAATIDAVIKGDSLAGAYRNVGNRGPRIIPFRAARGSWNKAAGSAKLVGRWDATFFQEWGSSPRVFEIRNGPAGLEGTLISNSGDYGHFWGSASADSFALGHFDGSFVYLLTGKLDGDTLRGVFHAGLRSETPWVAVRKHGQAPPQGSYGGRPGGYDRAVPVRVSRSPGSSGLQHGCTFSRKGSFGRCVRILVPDLS